MVKWFLTKVNKFTKKHDTYNIRQFILFAFDIMVLIISLLLSMYGVIKILDTQSVILLLTVQIIIMMPLFIFLDAIRIFGQEELIKR